jgi:hypothetical protein
MSCPINPIDCISDAASSVASSAWDMVCKSFADAADQLLKAFAQAFASMPNIDVTSPGVRNVYAISMGIAGFVAVLILLGQVVRTAITHDGTPVATALVGVGKTALSFMLILVFTNAALLASDNITQSIIKQSFGSIDAMSAKLGSLAAFGSAGGGVSMTLLLFVSVLALLATVVLWLELLIRNAALAVLVATSPISAVGQMSQATKEWWTKLCTACIQLIILKPVIALVFALGFNLSAGSKDIQGLLIGILVLLLAVFAWPVIGRLFTFASVQVGAAGGLGAMLGFAAGRTASAAGGAPTGIPPEQFARQSEARTMSAMSGRAGSSAAAGAPAMAGAGAGGAGAKAAAGAALGPMGIAAAGLSMAQKGVNALGGRMEQMAGHAGMYPTGPYSHPAGSAIPSAARSRPAPASAARPAAGQPAPAVSQQPVATSAPETVPERHAAQPDLTASQDRTTPPPATPEPAMRSQAGQTPIAEPVTPPTPVEPIAPRSDPPTAEFPAVRDMPPIQPARPPQAPDNDHPGEKK